MSSTPSDSRPPAFIHIDCDGLWAVRACYGPAEPAPPEGDPFHLEGIPAVLDLLRQIDSAGTFFVIGQDLDIERHRELFRGAIAAGHEIANHSQTHRMDLRTADTDVLWDEVQQASDSIHTHLGVKPAGFRAPGFSFHPELHRVLMHSDFTYDSSVFASPWGPAMRVARKFIGRSASVDQEPYGRIQDSLFAREPQLIERRRRRLMEIPVSVSQGLRLPVHASFALLRTDRSFEHTLDWHAQQALPFVWLIHLIDVCDTSGLQLPTPRWAGPLFRRGAEQKLARILHMLQCIRDRFNIVRTDQWARSELDRLPD